MIPEEILVLYASQTGQAQSISEYVHSTLSCTVEQLVPKPTFSRVCVSKFAEHSSFFNPPSTSPLTDPAPKSRLLITIASTTGDGDPPDTALKFYRHLKKLQRESKANQSLSPFCHITFALLGLGDTNYDNFANFGRNLNRIFQELGAVPFVETKYADDAVGLDTVTEPFIENLVDCVSNLLQDKSIDKATINQAKSRMQQPQQQSEVDAIVVPSRNGNENGDNDRKKPVLMDFLNCEHRHRNTANTDHERLEEFYTFLASPVIQGEPTEYRKFPTQPDKRDDRIFHLPSLDTPDISIEPISRILESNLGNEYVLYSGSAQAVQGKVLKQTEARCLHTAKIDFKVKLTIDSTMDTNWNIIPGDSYGILCRNSTSDMFTVFNRITVLYSSEAGVELQSMVIAEAIKKAAPKTLHLEYCGKIYDLFEFFSFAIDLRTVVKRRDLYRLSEFCSDSQEKNCLVELSARKANKMFENFLLPRAFTICDILRLFPSCQPNLGNFLALLNTGKPRYFSFSSFPANCENENKILGSIWVTLKNDFIHLKERHNDNVFGHFSGKFLKKNSFDALSMHRVENVAEVVASMDTTLRNGDGQCCLDELSHDHHVPIYVFHRANRAFQIPFNERDKSAIFISAGTGLSPFLSYLKNRHLYMQTIVDGENASQVALWHGARSEELLIGVRTLQKCLDSFAINSMHLCLSRQDQNMPLKYFKTADVCYGRVPERLKSCSKQIVKLLVDYDANIYICGSKAFEKDVKLTLQSICENSNLPDQFFNQLVSGHRIRTDQW